MAVKVQDVIGRPPRTYISDNFMEASIPVAEFTPCKPNFQSGMTLFTLEDDSSNYKKLLTSHGYSVTTPLKLAFLADNFPSDTFRNDYGANFLEKMTDVVSEGGRTISQMFGGQEATEVADRMGAELQKGGSIASLIGGGMQSGVQRLRGIGDRLEGAEGLGGAAKNMGNLADKLAAGQQVDFPQIWKNSAFEPSYTMTIRLYNPNPNSTNSTEKYIIGPLAAILALGLPISEGGETFNYPFFHKIKAKGLFILDPAIITNMTVIKGGDQQQISFNQRLSIVDVRLDVSGLYQTMVTEKEANSNPDRPTLAQYLTNLTEKRQIDDIYEVPGSGVSPLAQAGPGGEEETVLAGDFEPVPQPNEPTESRVNQANSDRASMMKQA